MAKQRSEPERHGPSAPDPAEKYIAASGRLHYAGGGRLWIVDPARGRVLEAPEEAGPILRVADRFRTLREHRQAVLELGWQDDGSGSLDALLASLVSSGALRSRRELLRRIQESAPEETPPPIRAVSWITRDRPELLRRSVESAIANLRLYGRRLDLKVYDDTADAQARQATRDMLAELGRREGFAVFYAGEEEKREFAAVLRARAAKSGVAADTVEFTLFDPFQIGYTPGANTNAVLLDTCGQLFLNADDDSVFRFASPPEAGPGLLLSSATDPTEVRFFGGRPEREAALELQDWDFLSAHENFLGRTVAACLQSFSGQIDCDGAAPEFLPVLESGSGSVAATMAGVCGDSGMGSALFVLWLTGRSRELALQSEDRYRIALRSREVVRAVAHATLTPGTLFMKMGIGLDNRQVLPPFLPVLRNEDGLFAQSLRVCLPQSLIAHLPLAMLHLPEGRRDFTGEKRVLPGLADLLVILVRHLAPAQTPGIPEQRLRLLGSGLVELGSLKPADFQGILRALWAAELSRHVLELEQLLDSTNGEPEYWAADAEDWLSRARLSVSGEGAFVPADLAARSEPVDALSLARRLIRSYGDLMLAWPLLRAAAAAEGASLARRL